MQRAQVDFNWFSQFVAIVHPFFCGKVEVEGERRKGVEETTHKCRHNWENGAGIRHTVCFWGHSRREASRVTESTAEYLMSAWLYYAQRGPAGPSSRLAFKDQFNL